MPYTFFKANLRLDMTSHKAFLMGLDKTEKDLRLTPTEFKLLFHFLKNVDRIVTREELLATIWGSPVHVTSHTIDSHISSLRKKIAPTQHSLRAVVKKGFCMTLKEPEPQVYSAL